MFLGLVGAGVAFAWSQFGPVPGPKNLGEPFSPARLAFLDDGVLKWGGIVGMVAGVILGAVLDFKAAQREQAKTGE